MTQQLARMSARNSIAVVIVWVVLTLAAIVVSAIFLSSAMTSELRVNSSFESERAARMVEEFLGGPEPISEVVVVQSDSYTVDDAEFRVKVDAVFEKVISEGGDGIASAFTYYQTGSESLVSADRRTTIVPMVMAGSYDDALQNVSHVFDALSALDDDDEFRVLTTGIASIGFESSKFTTHDLEQGERFGIPVALLILLALLASVVAALLPIAIGLCAIVISLGIVALLGQAFSLVFFVTLMITMIGLVVGIDYSLFMVSRFREELDRGLSVQDAVVQAGNTAGRTVMFSGVTVVIALCGLFMIPSSFFRSLGLGAILVVIVTMAATLTFLPAILALLGTRVDMLSIPFFRRRKVSAEEVKEGSDKGFWERTTRMVMRFPLISFLVVAVPMVVITTFYFDIETGVNGVETLPEGSITREAFMVLEENFAFGVATPSKIAIKGDVESIEMRNAIEKLQTAIVEDARFTVPPTLEVNTEAGIAIVTLAMPGHPSGDMALDGLSAIRNDYIPNSFAGVDAVVVVGGNTATFADLFEIVDTYTPIVFAFVLGLSFIVLLLVFRSIVIPIKAVIMNLLSVGTAYGMMVLVFQKGVGTELLGFERAEAIDVWVPLFLFTILFGLSMDYHVFLLSRVREHFDKTGDNAKAVSHGLRSTSSLITGAALIMVAVFGAFASGDQIVIQQIGFGLAVAILLDATLVRSVLVPASMEMLGKGNWYLPSWLQWLPDLRVEAEE